MYKYIYVSPYIQWGKMLERRGHNLQNGWSKKEQSTTTLHVTF